jgi:hypothetical protein
LLMWSEWAISSSSSSSAQKTPAVSLKDFYTKEATCVCFNDFVYVCYVGPNLASHEIWYV